MRLWQAVLVVGVGCVVPAGAILAQDVEAPDEPPHFVEIPLTDKHPSTAPTGASSSAVLPESSPQIDALVTQLGDADFRQREAAVAKLKEIGPAALPALKRARESAGDPEVTSRAEGIIRHVESPPGPGRMPGSGFGGGALTMRKSVRNGAHSVEVVEQGGRIIRIDERPNGIEMSVTGDDGKGQQVTRHFHARTPEELKQQNPAAFELFERWTGQGGVLEQVRRGQLMPRRLHPRFRQRVAPQLLPPLPADELEMVRRRLFDAAADAQFGREMADAQQRELAGILDELRRLQLHPRDAVAGLAPDDPALLPPRHARLGVMVIDAPAADGNAGVRIAQVMPGGRAEAVGLKPFDEITSINGQPVTDAGSLRRALTTAKPPLVIEATRDGKPLTLEEKK